MYTLGCPGSAPRMAGTSANPSPSSFASPAASRTVQVPVGSTNVRGSRARKDRDSMSTVCSTGVDACVVRSISRAPAAETSSARSMPAERTPAPAGHSVGGRLPAVGVEREQRDGDGRVEQRVPVDPPPRVGFGEPDGDAEDVGAVARRGPGGVDVRAARRHQPAGRDVDGHAGRPVVVVEEVGPEQGAAGEAAGAAGARELLAKRPSGGCRKLGLGPQRRGRHPFGHPVDHHEFGRRGRRRRCDRLQNRVGDV